MLRRPHSLKQVQRLMTDQLSTSISEKLDPENARDAGASQAPGLLAAGRGCTASTPSSLGAPLPLTWGAGKG